MPHRQLPDWLRPVAGPKQPESGRQCRHFAVAFAAASVAFVVAFVAFAGHFVGPPPGPQPFVRLPPPFVPPHLHQIPTGQKYIRPIQYRIVCMMNWI